MDIQIVMICMLIVEPQAVPRYSRIAPTPTPSATTTAAASPTSRASSRSRLLLAIYKFEGCVWVIKNGEIDVLHTLPILICPQKSGEKNEQNKMK